jgi:hypothetical protein
MSTQEHFSSYFKVLAMISGVGYWRELAKKIEIGQVRCGSRGDADKDAPAIDRGGRIGNVRDSDE